MIVGAPLSARDRDRFGVELFKTHVSDFEIWDVHRIFLPRQGSRRPASDGIAYRQFHTYTELAAATQRLVERDVVISLCGMLRGQEMHFVGLRKLLFDSAARVGAVAAGSVPPTKPLTNTQRLFRVVRLAISGRLNVRAAARRLLTSVSGSKSGVTSLRNGYWGLDWAWTGPSTYDLEPLLLAPKTQIRLMHTWDFDVELRYPVQRTQREGFVYVDSMGPLHPDFGVLQEQPYVSPQQWFKHVNAELVEIQARANQPVTVAAHPRAVPGSLDVWYPGFEVVYGRTRELVANACLVLSTEGSTVLGLCAMYDTPTLLLEAPAGWDGHLELLAAYAEELGLSLTSAACFPQLWHQVGSLGPRRDTFLSAWVRNPNAPLQPLWQTVIEDISDI